MRALPANFLLAAGPDCCFIYAFYQHGNRM